MPNPPDVFGFQDFQMHDPDVRRDSADRLVLTAGETAQTASHELPEQFIIEVSFRTLRVQPLASIEVTLSSS